MLMTAPDLAVAVSAAFADPAALERESRVAQILVDLCAAIDALNGPARQGELVTFARSSLFMAPGLLLDGVPGAIHREAWQALKRAAAADTPGRRWEFAPYARGRGSIRRLLAAEELPVYATLPFKTLDTDEGPRIAAAVGGPRLLTTGRHDSYAWLDLTDVLLWEPRENQVQIAGEPGAARLIMPTGDNQPDRLRVYRDPIAFLRDWVIRRVDVLRAHQLGQHQLETRDGCLPGALVVGDLDAIAWHEVHAPALVAGPGLDARTLRKAVFRAYQMPPVEEDALGDRR